MANKAPNHKAQGRSSFVGHWPLGVLLAIGPWELRLGGFGGGGFFGADDEAVFDRDRDGGGGEPISGLVEMSGKDGWGELPGRRIGFL